MVLACFPPKNIDFSEKKDDTVKQCGQTAFPNMPTLPYIPCKPY